MTSISKSSHLRVVAAGRLPAFSATIFSASVSATEVFGSWDDIIAVDGSNAEDLGVTRLDRVAFFFHGCGVILHGLDILERLAPRLLLGLRMHRTQTADVDDQLLGVAAKAERLKQFCRVRMRRVLEDTVRADDQWRSFAGINRLDRASRLLELKDVVLVAVRHDRALAEIELLRRGGRRVHPQDGPVFEFVVKSPAPVAFC